MPREISLITKRDIAFMKLEKSIRKVVKTKVDWNRFKKYMDEYYK